jgi:hypothetical protein
MNGHRDSRIDLAGSRRDPGDAALPPAQTAADSIVHGAVAGLAWETVRQPGLPAGLGPYVD